jgi:hypothetical protein
MGNFERRVVEQCSVLASKPGSEGYFKVGLRTMASKSHREGQRCSAIRRIDTFQHEDRANRTFSTVMITDDSSVPSDSTDSRSKRGSSCGCSVVQHIATTNSIDSCIIEEGAQSARVIGWQTGIIIGKGNNVASRKFGAGNHSREHSRLGNRGDGGASRLRRGDCVQVFTSSHDNYLVERAGLLECPSKSYV